MGLDLKDKVIIFDEAHNVEAFSEDACSSEVKTIDLDYTTIKDKRFKPHLDKLLNLKEGHFMFGFDMIKVI